ncbi:hypothetical protein [Bacillus changyiensis]|uniref:hypothetical protein n=1 Tax=Bacillus changyiensis TaxID=3004103 RepID=UPI0022E3479A|nr:hypothetical protein [Bacillus changyiensis]MDA1477633.1 hypothetical protein [Bacillus changyiensis]
MVKHISNIKMTQYLEDSSFLYAGGYGKGIPVYSRKGLDVIYRFVDVFRKIVNDEGLNVIELKHTKLVDKNDFLKMYKDINDYTDEIVEYGEKLVMSDVLINSFKYLKDHFENQTKSVFTCSSVYRDKANKLTPLYKDKNIFPVVQLDQIVKKDNDHENIKKLKKIYKNFFASIGIEIAFLETQEVPSYAKYELYFVTHDKGSLTKLGMIYVLSDQFKKNLKIDGDVELFDSGFSGKTLYKSLEITSQYCGDFSIHPYVADVDFLIASSNQTNKQQLFKELRSHQYNFQVLDCTKKSYKQWKKSGVLHYILVHDQFSLFTRDVNGEIKEKVYHTSTELLKRITEEKSIRSTETIKYSHDMMKSAQQDLTKNLCDDCYKKEFYGYYSDDKTYKCLSCGKIINKIILTLDPKKRFY